MREVASGRTRKANQSHLMLRDMRAWLGFSQADFADALNVAIWRLSSWEQGKATPAEEEWKRIIKVLVHALVKDTGDRRWAERFVLARLGPR